MARMAILGNKSRWLGVVGAVALGLVSIVPAFAADSKVTQTITCGGGGNLLSASIADLSLQDMTFAAANQNNSGNLTLTAGETGCAAKGWNVTVQAASAWTGSAGGSIPASNFSLTQIAAPTFKTGQPIDANGGPKLVSSTGNLDQSRKVVQANAGFGLGSYNQILNVTLAIPAYTLPGAYQTTVVTTITSAP